MGRFATTIFVPRKLCWKLIPCTVSTLLLRARFLASLKNSQRQLVIFLFNLFALYRNPSPRPPFTPFLTQLSSPGAMSIREVWFVYQYLCLLRNALRWSINQRTSQLYGNGPLVQTISRTISRCLSDLNSNLREIFFFVNCNCCAVCFVRWMSYLLFVAKNSTHGF